MKRYILKDGNPVEEPDNTKFAKWFGVTENRIVDLTEMPEHNCVVSTIFIGFGDSVDGAPPVLFGTMVSGGSQHLRTTGYTTLREAKSGHCAIVDAIKQIRFQN